MFLYICLWSVPLKSGKKLGYSFLVKVIYPIKYFLASCFSLSGFEVWSFLIYFDMDLGSIHVQLMFKSSFWWMFIGFRHYLEIQSHRKLFHPLTLTVCCSIFCNSSWAIGAGVFCWFICICIYTCICWLLDVANRICHVIMILKNSFLHFWAIELSVV